MHIRKIERTEVFMNTAVTFTIFSDKSTVKTEEGIVHAYGAFSEVVKKYTRFDSKSELSKLNNANIAEPFKVTKEMFELVEYMLKLSKISDGAYDPTIIDLLETYGFDNKQKFDSLDNPDLFQIIQELVKKRAKPTDIKLDKKNLTIKLARRQRLDLGSIGKGYAIDLAYNRLIDFPAYMINAGGDIRVKGPKPDDTDWQIALSKSPLPNKAPDKNSLIGVIVLKKGSVCGSGGWARRVRFFHHLINPKSGMPLNEISQTYVYAKTAMEADAWATILFALGEKGLDLIKKQKLQGLIVGLDGNINSTGKLFANL